ncbi:MAG: MBL fold metallo-hydrolase [Acidobacteria bacterium]|nr:MBL fold metallo-hydrolase [Acidobacteriota bacterium]
MRRHLVLGSLVAAGALVMAAGVYRQARAQEGQQPSTAAIQVEKLRDNLFVLRGGGGNTTVFVQANGVTVVDTKNPGWGQPLITKIKELTNKPVMTIVNTHTHGDHVSGNVDFAQNVDVVTHENTAANMKAMRPVTSIPNPPVNVFAQHGGHGLPKRTFKETMTLGNGNDRVDLHYFGRGHTNGDAWVVFPAVRVMSAGDIFSGKNLPLLDYNNGGSGAEIGDSLMKAYTATMKQVDSIVPGHSTTMTPNDLREYAEFNRDFLNGIREAKKAGRSVDEIVKTWKMPAKYEGYADPAPARLQANVENIYKEVR